MLKIILFILLFVGLIGFLAFFFMNFLDLNDLIMSSVFIGVVLAILDGIGIFSRE